MRMLSPVDFVRDLTPAKRRTFAEARRGLHSGESGIGLRYDRHGTVQHGAVEVHYYEVGPVDAPLAVVYAHGFNIAAEEFYMQVEALRPLGVRQVLVDVRGHGQTGRIDPGLLTIDAAADDIAAVMEHLLIDVPVVTVGHSLGGPISLSLMRRHDFCWAGSVQVSGAVDPFTARGMPRALGGAFGSALEAMVEKLPHTAEGLRVAITSTLAPVLARWFYFRPMNYEIIQFHAALIQETPLATYAGYFDDLKDHSERAAAGVLAGLPGYILVGERDNVTPLEQSAQLAEIWPDAYYQVLPESGHMPTLDAPAAVTCAIARVIERVTSETNPETNPEPDPGPDPDQEETE